MIKLVAVIIVGYVIYSCMELIKKLRDYEVM